MTPITLQGSEQRPARRRGFPEPVGQSGGTWAASREPPFLIGAVGTSVPLALGTRPRVKFWGQDGKQDVDNIKDCNQAISK